MMRVSSRMLLLVPMIIVMATSGCALRKYGGAAYSATAQMQINGELPPAQGRREAIQLAEIRARDQILTQAIQLRLNDGRTLEDLAITDPFVQAMLQDTVRAARIEDRTVSPEGLVSVTVTMELDPLYKMIDEYGAQLQ